MMIIPTESKVSCSNDKTTLQMVFLEDEGANCCVRVHRDNIPQFLQSLRGAIDTMQLEHNLPDLTTLGGKTSIQGFSVEKRADGGCILHASVRAESISRVFELSLDFSPRDLETLFPMMAGQPTSATH